MKKKAIHPGWILLNIFLKPNGISQYRLAKSIDVPFQRISSIVHEKCSITVNTGLKLSYFFKLPEDYWIHLQSIYDIEITKTQNPDIYQQIIVCQTNVDPFYYEKEV